MSKLKASINSVCCSAMLLVSSAASSASIWTDNILENYSFENEDISLWEGISTTSIYRRDINPFPNSGLYYLTVRKTIESELDGGNTPLQFQLKYHINLNDHADLSTYKVSKFKFNGWISYISSALVSCELGIMIFDESRNWLDDEYKSLNCRSGSWLNQELEFGEFPEGAHSFDIIFRGLTGGSTYRDSRHYYVLFDDVSAKMYLSPNNGSGEAPEISVKGGYLKLDTLQGIAPATEDCSDVEHLGRMVLDDHSDTIYVCSGIGWVSK